MALPVYPVAGQVQARAMQANNATAAQFGGETAAALNNVGKAIQFTGQKMAAIEEEEKAKVDAARVMEAYAGAKDRLREALYKPQTGDDPGGLYNRTLGEAAGVKGDVDLRSREIFQEAIDGLDDDDQRAAFDSMWQRTHEASLDSATQFEFSQMQEYRQAAQAAALQSLQDDAIANFDNPAVLAANVDAARAMVLANADGLPPEAIARAEREAVSKIHLSVIQRMAQEDPGDALDYYERIQDQVNGTDHSLANQIIGGVAEARQAKSAVTEITGNAQAVDIVDQVWGADVGEPMPITVRPEEAVQIARGLGVAEFEGMTPVEVQEFLNTEAGASTAKRVTTAALGVQLQAFNGDLEASLIAMTEGPDAATAFLNGGRDYGILADPEAAHKAVAAFVERYKGAAVLEGGSAGIQAALAGNTAGLYRGDATAFLEERFNPMEGGAALDLEPAVASRLASFISEAPEVVQMGLQVIRGEGEAADLGWMGGSFSEAPPEVQRWVHENAEQYGLGFPAGTSPWRIEAWDNPSGEAKDVVDQSFAALGLPVGLKPQTGSAAGFYTKPGGAVFTVAPTAGDLNTQLAAAEERYADNPPLLAEVQRQIKNQHATRVSEIEAQQAGAMQEAFGAILQGQKVGDMSPATLQSLGSENVSKLLTLEGKFQGGSDDKTDDAAYYSLVSMSPEEFVDVNLLDHADMLSGADFRALAEKQAALQRPGTAKDSNIAGMRTRTQIMSDTVTMLGLQPTKNSDDAASVVQLERVVDERINVFATENKRAPNATEVQEIVDGLLIEGRTGKAPGFFGNHFFGMGAGDTKRAYELTPEERNTFTVADGFADIPEDAHDVVATGYKLLYGEDPTEDGAVEYYNDLARVRIGATPMPPAGLQNLIAQALAEQLQRRPSDEEVAAFYTRMVERSAGLR